ncbi:MAG: DUF2953 domain-containing protein [Oscillospiraceae bacterium]|nr:DUF2953 domain-containing protein [Oscillospiraceae bacterium]
MKALAIVLAAVALLAMLPIGAAVSYFDGDARASLILGPFRISLFPGKPKKASKKTPKEKDGKKQKSDREQKSVLGSERRSIQEFLPFVQVLTDFLSGFRRKLRVSQLKLLVRFGGDDPAQKAIAYGNAHAVIANAMPLFARCVRIKNSDVRPIFDPAPTTFSIRFSALIWFHVGQILLLTLRQTARSLKILLKIRKNRRRMQHECSAE